MVHLMGFHGIYPLANYHFAMENDHFTGTTHYFCGQFSSLQTASHYQRVLIYNDIYVYIIL